MFDAIARPPQVSRWYSVQHVAVAAGRKRVEAVPLYSRKVVLLAIGVLLVLIFSKYFYVAGLEQLLHLRS